MVTPSIPGCVDLEEIGRGGFGIVYRAYQRDFDRQVAIKVLLGSWDDDAARSRFEREAVAMGRLSGHPHILTVYSAGFTEDGEAFLILPYLAGGSLADRIATRVLSWQEASVLTGKIAQALTFVHEQELVHRDVKPDNILFNSFGEPQLADFGIASVAGMAATASGVVTASVIHAAPEVLEGRRATAISDQYSLASTIFEAVAGTPAFYSPDDESLAPLLMRIVSEPVPDLRGRGLPAHACAAIERGMAKRPEERFPTVAAFAKDLLGGDPAATRPGSPLGVTTALQTINFAGADAAGAPEQPREPEPVSASPSHPGRSRILLAGGGALAMLVVIAAAALGLTWAGRDAPLTSPPGSVPDLAEEAAERGEREDVAVPDVRGLPADEASAEIRKAGLRPLVIREEFDGEPGVVFDQEYLDEEVAQGSLVRLVVAKEIEVAVSAPPRGVAGPAREAVAPAPAAPPGSAASGVPALPSGLFCRDLAGAGYGYDEVVWYWDVQAAPPRMDADGDGIPCATLYPQSAVAAYWNVREQLRQVPDGLSCQDLQAAGHTYREAIWYWTYAGRPARMDASGNGRPCQTVYSTAAVEEFWGP